MNDNQKIFVEADRTARKIAICFAVLLFIIGLFFRFYRGAPAVLLHAALWISCVIMWISGIYCIYLVVNSIGTGSFPGPRSKVPARCSLSFRVPAIITRGGMLVAAFCLIVFPVLVIRYVGGQT